MERNGHFMISGIIDNQGMHSDKKISLVPFFLLMWYICISPPVIIMLQKCKQTSTRKKLGILSSIRNYKDKNVSKQSTPEDILVDI